MYQRAGDGAASSWRRTEPEPLPDDVLRQVRSIVDKADRERATD